MTEHSGVLVPTPLFVAVRRYLGQCPRDAVNEIVVALDQCRPVEVDATPEPPATETADPHAPT